MDQCISKGGNDLWGYAETPTQKCILAVKNERTGLWGCWEDVLKLGDVLFTWGRKPSSEASGEIIEKYRCKGQNMKNCRQKCDLGVWSKGTELWSCADSAGEHH